MIKFTKLKHNPNTLETVLCWLVDREDGAGKPDKHTLEIDEAPPPEFAAGFDALREHVAIILGVPWQSSLTVTQVSLSYQGEDGVMGAIFSFQHPLETCKAPLCANTPLQMAEPLKESDSEDQCLTPECVETIDALIEAATAVLEGDRAQGVLFRPAKQTRAHGKFSTDAKPERSVSAASAPN